MGCENHLKRMIHLALVKRPTEEAPRKPTLAESFFSRRKTAITVRSPTKDSWTVSISTVLLYPVYGSDSDYVFGSYLAASRRDHLVTTSRCYFRMGYPVFLGIQFLLFMLLPKYPATGRIVQRMLFYFFWQSFILPRSIVAKSITRCEVRRFKGEQFCYDAHIFYENWNIWLQMCVDVDGCMPIRNRKMFSKKIPYVKLYMVCFDSAIRPSNL